MSLEAVFPKVTFGKFVQIDEPSKIRIGIRSYIGESCWISTCFPNTVIVIGENALIGRRSVISASKRLEIGSFCVLSPNVYVSDTNHNYKNILVPILGQGVSVREEVVVEENCWLGINTVIMSSVGRGSVIGANSVVVEEVPPFSMAVGSPAVVRLMYNPATNSWDNVCSIERKNKVIDDRKRIGIPNRKEYVATLRLAEPITIGNAAGCR